MERLFYEMKIQNGIKATSEPMAKQLGFEKVDNFLLYHNDVCPSCEMKFKVSHDRTVKGVGAVALAVVPDMKKVFPYVVCKPCSKVMSNEKSNKVEEYILGKLDLLDE